MGAGGVGKTTLMEAVSFLIRGQAPGLTDRTGKALRPIPTYGTDTAAVAGEFDDGMTVTRSVKGEMPKAADQTLAITLNGVPEEGTNKDLQTLLYGRTCDEGTWSIMLDSAQFCGLSEGDAAKLLFNLGAAGRITVELVREMVVARLKKAHEDPQSKEAQAAVEAGLSIFGKVKPLDFDLVLGQLRKKRPETKKLLKTLEDVLAAAPPEVKPDELAALRGQKDALSKQQTAIARATDPAPEIAALITKMAEPLADPAEIQERLDARAADIDTAKLAKGLDPSGELRAAREVFLVISDKGGGSCPSCGQKITKSGIGVLETSVSRLEREYEDYQIRVNGLEAVETEVATLKTQLRDAKDAGTQRKTDASRLSDLRVEAVTFKGLPKLGTVNEELGEVNSKLASLTAAQEKTEERATAEKQVAGVTAKLAAINVLIDAYDPKGIRAELSAVEDDFMDTVQSALRVLFGENARLKASDATITQDGETWERVAALSESKRVLVGLAIQVGIAVARDVRLIITDRVAEMDQEDHGKALSLLAGTFSAQPGTDTTAPDSGGTVLLLHQIPRRPEKRDPETDADIDEWERAHIQKFGSSNSHVTLFHITRKHVIEVVEAAE